MWIGVGTNCVRVGTWWTGSEAECQIRRHVGSFDSEQLAVEVFDRFLRACYQTVPSDHSTPSKEGQRACVIKLIGGSDGGQGSIREGDSTINPFPQMRYFSAPSSVGVRIFNRGLHLLTKIAKAVPWRHSALRLMRDLWAFTSCDLSKITSSIAIWEIVSQIFFRQKKWQFFRERKNEIEKCYNYIPSLVVGLLWKVKPDVVNIIASMEPRTAGRDQISPFGCGT